MRPVSYYHGAYILWDSNWYKRLSAQAPSQCRRWNRNGNAMFYFAKLAEKRQWIHSSLTNGKAQQVITNCRATRMTMSSLTSRSSSRWTVGLGTAQWNSAELCRCVVAEIKRETGDQMLKWYPIKNRFLSEGTRITRNEVGKGFWPLCPWNVSLKRIFHWKGYIDEKEYWWRSSFPIKEVRRNKNQLTACWKESDFLLQKRCSGWWWVEFPRASRVPKTRSTRHKRGEREQPDLAVAKIKIK